MEFKACTILVSTDPDWMKCLRRMEDTDSYFLCDKISNPDKEERISVDGFSKFEDPSRSHKRWQREHDNEGRKTTRDLQTKWTEDSSISQAMLDLEQERVALMQNEVAGLRDKLQRTSQEAKEKLQQEKPTGSGSRESHK